MKLVTQTSDKGWKIRAITEASLDHVCSRSGERLGDLTVEAFCAELADRLPQFRGKSAEKVLVLLMAETNRVGWGDARRQHFDQPTDAQKGEQVAAWLGRAIQKGDQEAIESVMALPEADRWEHLFGSAGVTEAPEVW